MSNSQRPWFNLMNTVSPAHHHISRTLTAVAVVMTVSLGLGQSNDCMAEQFKAKVIAVADGDTITIQLSNGKQERVRFLICDAPESNQPYGDKSADFTRKATLNKTVTIKTESRDTYGRILGEVILADGTSLNRELIRQGLAHWFYHYNSDPKAGMLEVEAKTKRRGLWADDSPLYPRAWRRGARLTPSDPPPPVTNASGIVIFSAMPNPRGLDAGNEVLTIANFTDAPVNLLGWTVRDDDGGQFPLSGMLKPNGRQQFKLDSALQLSNSGDTLELVDKSGKSVHRVSYVATSVKNGIAIQFVERKK